MIKNFRLIKKANLFLPYTSRPVLFKPVQRFFNSSPIDLDVIRLLFVIFILLIIIIMLSNKNKSLKFVYYYVQFLSSVSPLFLSITRLVFFSFSLALYFNNPFYLKYLAPIFYINWIFTLLLFPLLKKVTLLNYLLNYFIGRVFCTWSFIMSITLLNSTWTVEFIFFLTNIFIFYLKSFMSYSQGLSTTESEKLSSPLYSFIALLAGIFDSFILDNKICILHETKKNLDLFHKNSRIFFYKKSWLYKLVGLFFWFFLNTLLLFFFIN